MVGPKILPGILVVTILLTAQSSFAGSTSDECRTSPGPSARAGLHWYYRTDPTNNRHCWYLGNAASHPTSLHENVAEQAQEIQSQNDTVQTALQTSVNTSDNNLVTIATGNTFQQVAGANGGTERQALIIKNNNTNGDTCWVFFGSNKASKEKSVIIASGDSYVRYWPFVSSDAMQAACASTSDTLVVEIKQARLQPTP